MLVDRVTTIVHNTYAFSITSRVTRYDLIARAGRAKPWCLLIHVEACLSLAPMASALATRTSQTAFNVCLQYLLATTRATEN